MKKNILILCIFVIVIGAFGYVTAKTELVIWDDLWDTTASTYELQENEVLYTATHFVKKGLAPICIRSIEFFEPKTMTKIESEGYLCHVEKITEGWYPPGFGIEQKSFFDEFGENMIPKNDAKWINEDFVVIEIKDSNEVTDTYCRVTYSVWGIVEKATIGTSRE